jgi:hypothetical protein
VTNPETEQFDPHKISETAVIPICAYLNKAKRNRMRGVAVNRNCISTWNI